MTAYVIVKLYGFSMELPVQKFGPALAKFSYQYTRNAYCWNPLVKHFQKSESTPFNPWVVAVLRSFKYRRLGLLSACAYKSERQGNMHLNI